MTQPVRDRHRRLVRVWLDEASRLPDSLYALHTMMQPDEVTHIERRAAPEPFKLPVPQPEPQPVQPAQPVPAK